MTPGEARSARHDAAGKGGEANRSIPLTALLALAGVFLVALAILAPFPSSAKEFSEETPMIEKKLTGFIKQFYGEEDDIQVKFNSIPEYLKGKTKVKSISFAKVPDAQGNGLCLVEFAAKDTKERNAYVSFKVFKKKVLFMMKRTGRKGEIITAQDVLEKDAHLTGTTAYPGSREDVVGKILKKDIPAGTVITSQVLEDRVLVQTGEIVNIVAENPRLAVHASGRALDRGKMGDTVRVKNLTSGKEIYGKVTGSSMVSVEF